MFKFFWCSCFLVCRFFFSLSEILVPLVLVSLALTIREHVKIQARNPRLSFKWVLCNKYRYSREKTLLNAADSLFTALLWKLSRQDFQFPTHSRKLGKNVNLFYLYKKNLKQNRKSIKLLNVNVVHINWACIRELSLRFMNLAKPNSYTYKRYIPNPSLINSLISYEKVAYYQQR